MLVRGSLLILLLFLPAASAQVALPTAPSLPSIPTLTSTTTPTADPTPDPTPSTTTTPTTTTTSTTPPVNATLPPDADAPLDEAPAPVSSATGSAPVPAAVRQPEDEGTIPQSAPPGKGVPLPALPLVLAALAGLAVLARKRR